MCDDRKILSPFNPREAISTQEAAERSGKSVGTIRFWCDKHGIGRKVAREWHVSRPALEMLLEDDWAALHLYHAGERDTETVARYFERYCPGWTRKPRDSNCFPSNARVATTLKPSKQR